MFRFLLSRLLGAVVVLALVAVFVFALTRMASGDPVALLLGDQATAQDIAQARVQYGLDKPLPTQFVLWVGELLQGNLGQSLFLQQPVSQAIAERLEPTLTLALLAVLIAACIGIPCGMVAAIWRGSPADQVLSSIAMLGASIPSFWFGLILIQIFAVKLGWFPASGYGDPDSTFGERIQHLLLLLERGVIRAHQKVVTAQGQGEVTSGTFSPTLQQSVALARLPLGVAIGDTVTVEIRDKMLSAKVVKPCFARNGKAMI